jgi:hypothetical protein
MKEKSIKVSLLRHTIRVLEDMICDYDEGQIDRVRAEQVVEKITKVIGPEVVKSKSNKVLD